VPRRQGKSKSDPTIPIFINIKKGHLPIACISMISINRYLDDLRFYAVFDYNPGYFDKFILSRYGLNITVLSNKNLLSYRGLLKKYKWCESFFGIGWQGKKFFVPILFKDSERVVVLDCDTIFLKNPTKFNMWLKTGKKSTYMEDCGNYLVISSIEAKEILKRNINIHNFNSGLLGINLNNFWQHNSLNQIENYIKQILAIMSSRQVEINRSGKMYGFTNHLFEQTLYWLTFSNSNAEVLGNNYYLIGKHIFNMQKIGDPDFIHFAGEGDKRTMYMYLFFSLTEWLGDKIFMKLKNDNPWYAYSKQYCYRCRIAKNNRHS
jgi:lipopolysaccharide biosynthesis glycosyltransferase